MPKTQKKAKVAPIKASKVKAPVKAAKAAKVPAAKTVEKNLKKPVKVSPVEKPTKAAIEKPVKAVAEKPAKPASTEPAAAVVEAAPVAAKAAKGTVKVSMKGVQPKKPRRMSKVKEAMLAEKAGQMSQKWTALFKKSQELQAKPYNMRQTFEAKTPILHKVLGWGYILTNKNDRLEVLFKDGIRFLISNYKA